MEGYHPASVTYLISIQGLNESYSDGPAEILVPMPLKDGKPLFEDGSGAWLEDPKTLRPDKKLQSWNVSVVDTEYGPMISLKTDGKGLYDLRAQVSRQLTFKEGDPFSVNSIMNDPFNPAFNKTTFDFLDCYHHQYERPNDPPDYNSRIYVNDNIKPIKGKAGAITLNFTLTVNSNSYGNVGDFYTVYSDNDIMADERGMISVNISYNGHYSTALHENRSPP